MKPILRYITPLLTSLLPSLFLLMACKEQPSYDATGIFEATTVTVAAETSGKILSMKVEEGDSIETGREIALIDTALFTLQSRQLESQGAAAIKSTPDIETQTASLRTQIAHQENECQRLERLLADGAAPTQRYDDAKAQLKMLKDQLQATLSSLRNSTTSIAENADAISYQRQQTEEQIARSRILSPLRGTVLVKYAETGEFATPGKPLCKIADLDRIYLRAYFTSAQLADIKLGQKVTVIADFGADNQYEYPGTITWIAEECEFTPKSIQTPDSRANLVYAVKIVVKNDGRLKLGQYGEVRL